MVPCSKERSWTSSLEFRSPCTWLFSVVPPRRQSGQMCAASLCRICLVISMLFHSFIFLRRCPRSERSRIVVLRQSTRIKSIDKVKMEFHVQKKIAALVALLCNLISASQLTYLLINLHSMFDYRGRQRLAQIFVSSQRQRIWF